MEICSMTTAAHSRHVYSMPSPSSSNIQKKKKKKSGQSEKKKKKTKTFDGCWSCRERGIKCDELKPQCSNCLKNSILCKGYDIRLSWDVKKTDNLRRFKIYDHFELEYFHIDDLNQTLAEIDEMIEIHNYRNLQRLPFTVFESNKLIQYWRQYIIHDFQIPWLEQEMLNNLNHPTIIKSIYACTLYFKGHSIRAQQYQDEILKEENQDDPWIYSVFNILLTSNIVHNCKINYFETVNKISTLSPGKHITSVLNFFNSLKLIKPAPSYHTLDLQDIGITNNLLEVWYEILSLNSNTNLAFFRVEDELWFNKKRLFLPQQHKNHHKSYLWYIAMYIYFIRKFYHEIHGHVSINYLINELIPHLQHIDTDNIMGFRWSVFIIANESTSDDCNDILSHIISKFEIPITANYIQFIETTNKIII